MLRLAVALLLFALPALAQQPVDPRLAGPMLQALQAELALRDAIIKAQKEDEDKQKVEMAEWFKAWFAATPETAQK
jgi:hypothetical protein